VRRRRTLRHPAAQESLPLLLPLLLGPHPPPTTARADRPPAAAAAKRGKNKCYICGKEVVKMVRHLKTHNVDHGRALNWRHDPNMGAKPRKSTKPVRTCPVAFCKATLPNLGQHLQKAHRIPYGTDRYNTYMDMAGTKQKRSASNANYERKTEQFFKDDLELPMLAACHPIPHPKNAVCFVKLFDKDKVLRALPS
jgi:hypothetical protein